MKINKKFIPLALLLCSSALSINTFASTLDNVAISAQDNIPEVTITFEEVDDTIEYSDTYDMLATESLLTRGASKPTATYNYASEGEYTFNYSNNASITSGCCWSNYQFTNCNSTMYLRLNDGKPNNTSDWYYEVYCNGKSIGSFSGKPGKSYICTISNLSSSDKVYFYVAAGSQAISGSGSFSSSK